MSAKAPIYLKRGSRKGKKEKLRDILSSDMISPPLGDFRHTIHIGSGGENDMFGDISFLQGKFDLLPRIHGSHMSQRSSQIEVPFEFSHTTKFVAHTQANMNNQSPLLKNAISLPVIGGPQAVILPTTEAPPPKPPRLHLEDKTPTSPIFVPDHNNTSVGKAAGEAVPPSNNWTVQRAPNSLPSLKPGSVPQNGFPVEATGNEAFLSQAGSLLSLHVDLGPSILDDVLQIMDKHQGDSVHLQEPGWREIHT